MLSTLRRILLLLVLSWGGGLLQPVDAAVMLALDSYLGAVRERNNTCRRWTLEHPALRRLNAMRQCRTPAHQMLLFEQDCWRTESERVMDRAFEVGAVR